MSILWNLYNDQGQLGLSGYTEGEARTILSQDESGTVYAENATGDFIETHDGPVNSGSSGKWYVYDNTETLQQSRVSEDRAREVLSKLPVGSFAKCPATNTRINQ